MKTHELFATPETVHYGYDDYRLDWCWSNIPDFQPIFRSAWNSRGWFRHDKIVRAGKSVARTWARCK